MFTNRPLRGGAEEAWRIIILRQKDDAEVRRALEPTAMKMSGLQFSVDAYSFWNEMGARRTRKDEL
ncbi:hypothetical protein SBA2_10103 [Acidobacteriia bacterium SbA2]|nr:hypothetical protein SBA2_10103 [Acidobacteriia bacterium SbA2]